MNKKTFVALFIGLAFFLSSIGFGAASAATAVPHTTYPAAKDWVPNVPYSCATPMDESNVTQILAIQAGTPGVPISYNTTTLYANLGACVKLVLNDSVSLWHDFTLDKVSSTGNDNNSIPDANLNKAEINAIDMDVSNSTADVGFGPGLNVFYAWMPTVKSSFTYYCGQPGHEAAGMKGTLYVGYDKSTSTQSAAPGFELLPVMLAFLGVATIAIVARKHKRN